MLCYFEHRFGSSSDVSFLSHVDHKGLILSWVFLNSYLHLLSIYLWPGKSPHLSAHAFSDWEKSVASVGFVAGNPVNMLDIGRSWMTMSKRPAAYIG